MDCSTPGFHVYYQLLELAQTYVHWVGDTIQSSYPLTSPFLCAFNPPWAFPESGSFPMSRIFASGSQSIIALASVLPVNIQDWFPLFPSWWTDLISSQFKGTLKSPLWLHNLKASIPQCSAFFMVQLSYPYMTTGKNHMDLCQ